MKGFISGVLATGVVTAVILLFMLEGRQEVQIQQERHIVTQRLNEAEFDRDFSNAWNSMNGREVSENENDQKSIEIARLKERQKAFDKEFDQAFNRTQNDAEALRRELESQSQLSKE